MTDQIQDLNRHVAELKARIAELERARKSCPETEKLIGLLKTIEPSEDEPDWLDISLAIEDRDKIVKEWET